MDGKNFSWFRLGGPAILATHLMLFSSMGGAETTQTVMLPPLPWAEDALAPYISARTIGFHYGKHHQAYVDKTNTLIKGTQYESMKLEEIVKATAGKPDATEIFNNSAQVWNHTFYWSCLKPNGGGEPNGELLQMINKSFGSMEKFKEEFAKAATTQFGSGWAWLVMKDNSLKVIKTSNADTPIAHDMIPLLTLDVWEHAYYLDYQNKRPDYVKAVMDHLINWDFAAQNLEKSAAMSAKR